MADWRGFGGLDLTGVKEFGANRLGTGRHIVRVKKAEVAQIEGTNNRKLVVEFEEVSGLGEIRENFNIFHSHEKAQEMGLRALKSMLICGGHRSPDRPGDVATLRGLTLGIVVADGEPWRDKEGKMRTTSEVKSYFKPGDAAPEAMEPEERGARPVEIPF